MSGLDSTQLIDTPLHWSWPFLATGLVLQGLDVAYARLGTTRAWVDNLLTDNTLCANQTGVCALGYQGCLFTTAVA